MEGVTGVGDLHRQCGDLRPVVRFEDISGGVKRGYARGDAYSVNLSAVRCVHTRLNRIAGVVRKKRRRAGHVPAVGAEVRPGSVNYNTLPDDHAGSVDLQSEVCADASYTCTNMHTDGTGLNADAVQNDQGVGRVTTDQTLACRGNAREREAGKNATLHGEQVVRRICRRDVRRGDAVGSRADDVDVHRDRHRRLAVRTWGDLDQPGTAVRSTAVCNSIGDRLVDRIVVDVSRLTDGEVVRDNPDVLRHAPRASAVGLEDVVCVRPRLRS